MNTITLENFRCFRERQQVRLAPLTLLVGENSTGKTSFMAFARALWDAAYLHVIPDFKEAPYDLGSFDEIAHYRGGRAGRALEFSGGFDAVPTATFEELGTAEAEDKLLSFEVTFGRKGTAPVPTRVRFGFDDVAISQHIGDDMSREIRFRTSRGEWMWQIASELHGRLGADRRVMADVDFFFALADKKNLRSVGRSPKFTSADERQLERLFFEFESDSASQSPFASAPVRSKPRRTYDPLVLLGIRKATPFRCIFPRSFSRRRSHGRR